MKTYTLEGAPKGYAIVRYSFLSWGFVWLQEDGDPRNGFHSRGKRMTYKLAVAYAYEIERMSTSQE